MASILKRTLIAGAVAATMAAGMTLVPGAASASPFGYNYTHGYTEQGDPVYGGDYYAPGVAVGVAPGYADEQYGAYGPGYGYGYRSDL